MKTLKSEKFPFPEFLISRIFEFRKLRNSIILNLENFEIRAFRIFRTLNFSNFEILEFSDFWISRILNYEIGFCEAILYSPKYVSKDIQRISGGHNKALSHISLCRIKARAHVVQICVSQREESFMQNFWGPPASDKILKFPGILTRSFAK